MSGTPRTATAVAHSNIALVKYWGKRDAVLNLPAAGSLSLTLAELTTRTTVTFQADRERDELRLAPRGDAVPAPRSGAVAAARVSLFLDLVRARAGTVERALVVSENDFPTASGLASSASAFAALALAATRAAGVELTPAELSALARRGSGSAARSVFGGFVEMLPGVRDDGADSHAVPLLDDGAWDVRLVVAVVGGGAAKPVSSRSGMDHTAATSPLYPAWIGCVAGDLAEARAAIGRRDLAALGDVAERSALTMHATALAARAGVLYWRGATVDAVHAVRELRARGVGAWATIDAGPHVKALCAPSDADGVAAALGAVPGVTSVRICRPGPGAQVVA